MNDLFEIKQDEITLRCEATEMEEGQGSIYIEEYVPDIEADKKLLIYGGLVPTKALNITVKSLALLHEAGGSFSAYFCVDRLLEKKCKNKLVKNELDGCCFYAEGAKALEILTKLCGYVLFMPEDRLDCFMLCSSENVSLKDGVLTPINTNECRMITQLTEKLVMALPAFAAGMELKKEKLRNSADESDDDEPEEIADSSDNADDNEISEAARGITAEKESDERSSSAEPISK